MATINKRWIPIPVNSLMLIPLKDGIVLAAVTKSSPGINEVEVSWGDVVMTLATGFGPSFPVFVGEPSGFKSETGNLIGQCRKSNDDWVKELEPLFLGSQP